MNQFSRSISLLSAVCLACILAFSAAVSAASDETKPFLTNYQVLERLSRESALEIAVSLARVPAGSVVSVFKSKGSGDADFIVENSIVKVLTDRGFAVSLEKSMARDSAAASPQYRIVYQVIRMPLWYERIGRSHGIGKKYVQRAAKLDLFVELAETASGGIVWVGETNKSYRDRIPYGSLTAVEEEQYGFTKPPRHEIRWSRFIEPVVVSGIIGGLVYLFFSNQSDE